MSIKIEYTTSNILKEVFPNGFYKYYIKMESLKCNDENNFKFKKAKSNCINRQ